MHDVFFFTDIHGMGCLYDTVMNYCLKEDPECMIIFGGDACDRGPDGYRIMKELLANPQVTYLKGNHEDMFVQAARSIIAHDDDMTMLKIPAVYNVIYNGGWPTLKAWLEDGKPIDIINKIDDLPYCCTFENIDFCHAGGQYKVFTRIKEAAYNDEYINKNDETHVLWDRNCIGIAWAPDRICVHGHTPTTYLPAKYYCADKSLANAHPCAYTGKLDDRLTGRKIDMDTGACASGRAYVLNCLTLQAIGFQDMEFMQDEIRNHDVKQIEVIQF